MTELVAQLRSQYPFLSDFWARRLVRAYGTEAAELLSGAKQTSDLGQEFGATLTERELSWLMTHEYARTVEDVIWRRNKLGLRLTAEQIRTIRDWMMKQRQAASAAEE